jgi:hypothetical protein
VRTGAGALVSEATVGQGRVIYIAVPPDLSSGSFPVSGLFAATLVRSTLYVVAPRDQGLNVALGESVSIPLPARLASREAFSVRDQSGVNAVVKPVRLSTATLLAVPAQYAAGVTIVSTTDSLPVVTVAANASTKEARLEFFEDSQWKGSVDQMVLRRDHVAEISAGTSIAGAIRQARTGSELWPLATVLALACAVAEMFVARFFVRDAAGDAS